MIGNGCYLECKDDTDLALTILPAFSSTISSNPMAKISMGLALLSVNRKTHISTKITTKKTQQQLQGWLWTNWRQIILYYYIHTLKLLESCHLGSVQKPVIERLVAEGNTAKLLTPIDIPGTNTHSDLFGLGVFLVTLTHSQQHSWRSCDVKESYIRHLIWWLLKKKAWHTGKQNGINWNLWETIKTQQTTMF